MIRIHRATSHKKAKRYHPRLKNQMDQKKLKISCTVYRAVSYTHLDVYKRQQRNIADADDTLTQVKSVEEDSWERWQYEDMQEPVSYTHLRRWLI